MEAASRRFPNIQGMLRYTDKALGELRYGERLNGFAV